MVTVVRPGVGGTPKAEGYRSTMITLDKSQVADAIGWLMEQMVSDDYFTGFEVTGWEDEAWILHSVYQSSMPYGEMTHDEIDRIEQSAGTIEPAMVGDVNVSGIGIATGVPLGYVPVPGDECTRVRWYELLGVPIDEVGREEVYPPSSYWFPYRSWPARIMPPPEGSMDELTYQRLLHDLADHSADGTDTECIAYYNLFGNKEVGNTDDRFLGCSLEEIGGLVTGDEPFHFTPASFWPEDRSWFVWTDWDLSGTKVSGSAELIAGLRADEQLEVISWSAKPK